MLLALFVFASAASADVAKDTPEYVQSFSNPGPVTVEDGSGASNFAWFADNAAGGSKIYGYLRSTGVDNTVQTTIDRSGSDPEGEIGEISGMVFDEVNDMLYIADTQNNRILWYPRVNAVPPASQVVLASVGQMPGPVAPGPATPSGALGHFDGLRGLTLRSDGLGGVELIAVDKNNARLQIFDSSPTGLSNPAALANPGWSFGGAEPQDVAVDPRTGLIYTAMLGSADGVQITTPAGQAAGAIGSSIDGGSYNQIDWDDNKAVLIASKAARVDVLSPESKSLLGSYLFTKFSEPENLPDHGNRMVKFMATLTADGKIFMTRFNPSGILAGYTEPDDLKPAQSYTQSNPPTCTPEAPVAVALGATENFTPNCTDADGASTEEFSVGVVTRGSAAPAANLHSIDVTAPSLGEGGFKVSYRVKTIDGISAEYSQRFFASGSTTVASEYAAGRASAATLPGIAYAEGVGGIAKYLWQADSNGARTILRGYNQVDTGAPQISTIDCSVSSTAGQLGANVTGIAFLPNESLLAVADASNDRIVIYPRVDNDLDPVDCDGATVITSVEGTTLDDPTGLSASIAEGTFWVSATFDDGANPPSKGIIAFPPGAPFLQHYRYNYAGLDPAAIAVSDNGLGRVFTAKNNGTIEASAPSLIDPLPGPSGNPIPPMSSGTPGNFVSLSAESNTNRLFAMKANELDVFSMTSGTLLGTAQGTSFENASSVATIQNYQQFFVAGTNPNEGLIREFWAYPNPICTPGSAISVNFGESVTFTPSCTDTDSSTVREFSVTNSQSRGAAAATPNLTAIKYTAGTAAGQDDIAYRVQTQDGLSVEKHQAVNVVAPVAAPPEEQPVVRKTTNLQLDSGDVYIKVPGSNKFVKLTEDTLVPMGTIIDATKGKAHLTFDNGDGTTQDGIFWEGIFQVSQGSGTPPITIIKLRDDLVKQASTARAASALVSASVADSFEAWISRRRGKKKNGVWGDAKGRFRTSGKGGSASVNGTRWYVADYTYGALFKVARGKVTVDPIRGKNFPLKAGKQKFVWYKKP
jgi:sugar lactone lactonase YvrE